MNCEIQKPTNLSSDPFKYYAFYKTPLFSNPRPLPGCTQNCAIWFQWIVDYNWSNWIK